MHFMFMFGTFGLSWSDANAWSSLATDYESVSFSGRNNHSKSWGGGWFSSMLSRRELL